MSNLRNFVNGEYVDAEGRRLRRPDRSDARARYSRAPRSPVPPMSTRPWPRPPPRSNRGATRRRPSASSRCCASPTRSSRGPRSSSRSRAEHRQAARADDERGDAAGSRPDAVLRRRRPDARGQVRRASTWPATPPTSGASRSASARQVTPWNYPLMMAIWKIAPALAAGNTRRAQAVRHHARVDAAAGRDRGRVPAARRLQRRLRRPRHRPRAGRRTRRRRWSRSPARPAPASRSPPPPRSTSSGPTSNSAARRRSSSSTTPTWRRRPRRSRWPATSTRARTAPRRPGCWPVRAFTTTSSPP